MRSVSVGVRQEKRIDVWTESYKDIEKAEDMEKLIFLDKKLRFEITRQLEYQIRQGLIA